MGMWGGLIVVGIAEHVVEQAHQAIQRLGGSVEHMFGRLRGRSDGTGVLQETLQVVH
jgi:hypothetical protein